MEKALTPSQFTLTQTDVQNDASNPVVQQLLGDLQKAYTSLIRINKMSAIDENRTKKNDLHALLPPRTSPRKLKSSFLFQIPRRYQEEGLKVPYATILPKTKDDTVTAVIAQAARDDVYNRGGFKRAYEKAFNAMLTDGTSFIHRGIKNEKIVFEQVNAEDIFFDPHASDIDNDADDDTMDWMARRYKYQYRTFVRLYPHLEGKVAAGCPVKVDTGQFTGKTQPTLEVTSSDEIQVFRFWSKSLKRCVDVCGSSNTIGKDVEWTDSFPLDAYHFSNERIGGFYSLSLYDAIKDVAEVYKQILNDAVSHIGKTVNPYIFLFTDEGDTIINEMKRYDIQRELGRSPMIVSRDRDTNMKSIAPTSIAEDLERILGELIDDLSKRLGLNLRQQEVSQQTATEYLRKSEFENTAISNINKINVPTFARSSTQTLKMIEKTWKTSDAKRIEIKLDTGAVNIYALPAEVILLVLKDFEGNIEVDTSISLPLTKADQVEALTEISIDLKDLMALSISSKEEAAPFVALIKEKLLLRQIKAVTPSQLDGMVNGIIARNQAMQNAQTPTSPSGTPPTPTPTGGEGELGSVASTNPFANPDTGVETLPPQ